MTPDKDTFMRYVGGMIGRHRKRMELTKRELAEALRYGHSAITNIENGKCNLRLSDLLDIAKALDCEPDELLRGFYDWCDDDA